MSESSSQESAFLTGREKRRVRATSKEGEAVEQVRAVLYPAIQGQSPIRSLSAIERFVLPLKRPGRNPLLTELKMGPSSTLLSFQHHKPANQSLFKTCSLTIFDCFVYALRRRYRQNTHTREPYKRCRLPQNPYWTEAGLDQGRSEERRVGKECPV